MRHKHTTFCDASQASPAFAIPRSPAQTESYLLRSGSDDAALRRASGPRFQGTVRQLNGGTQPPRDVQPEPRNLGMVSHGALDQIVIQGVEEGLDVKINDPVVLPAALPRHTYRIERRLAGSIAVRGGVEHRLHAGLEDHLRDRLRHSIGYRRDAEWALAAVVLRYFDQTHGRWEVRARRHPIPDLVEIPLEVLLERRQRLPVYPCRSAVCLHPLIRVPDELLRNVVGLATDRSSSHYWLATPRGRSVGPLRSTRVTRLHRSYEPVRPCATHRYSAPRGSATWRSPLASRHRFPRSAQEPALGSRRLCADHHPGSKAGLPPGSSQATERSLVSMASTRFRHVAGGSLSFVFPAHT